VKERLKKINSAEQLVSFLDEHFQRLADLDETTDWTAKDWYYAGIVVNLQLNFAEEEKNK